MPKGGGYGRELIGVLLPRLLGLPLVAVIKRSGTYYVCFYIDKRDAVC